MVFVEQGADDPRYFSGWYLLSKALTDSLKALSIPMFFLLIIVFFGACSLYWSENGVPLNCDLSEFQNLAEVVIYSESRAFENCGRRVLSLIDAMIFCLVCVISIDVSPAFGIEVKSDVGQWIAITMMILGVVFMAMPIAIVGTCFSDTWFNRGRTNWVIMSTIRSWLNVDLGRCFFGVAIMMAMIIPSCVRSLLLGPHVVHLQLGRNHFAESTHDDDENISSRGAFSPTSPRP